MNTFLFVSILTLLTSCSGKSTSHSVDKTAPLTVGDTVNKLGNNIMVVFQDTKNNYWFGSWETGLYRYDASLNDSVGQGKTIIHFTTQSGLPNNRIEEIKEDKSGNIYINTPKGISKFDGLMFTTLAPIESNEWKLLPDDLWFKGGQGMVYRYDGKSLFSLKLPKHYLDKENERDFPKHAWGPYDVYTIYKDSKENIWFGTAVLGACRYDGKSFDWISEEDVTELHNGPANGVRSIIEDKDGYFWFNSMYRYNVYGNNSSSTFYTREKSVGNLNGKEDGNLNEYLSIAKDNNNELWIATYTQGIWHYNGKDIAHYPVTDGTKDITVFSIYKDHAGNLWLGTHENGAYKFNGQTFERFK